MSSHFSQICLEHSQKTLKWVKGLISVEGKLSNYPDDLVCYYKLPYFLAINGETILANQVLDYITKTFFKEGNLITFTTKKTGNPLMAKFWGYVIGWIAIASQKLGRFDISYPAFNYLSEFQSQDHGGFATSEPWGQNDSAMDIITSAQLGRFALFFGQQKSAMKAGEFLGWMINNQPKSIEKMYLFLNNNAKYVTDFPQDLTFIYELKKNEPNQAYFMIGLPCAFLVELYQATHNINFLHFAKQYAKYALNCHESIKSFHFSHKVAWAMSLLYKQTKEDKYLNLGKAITEYLISIQDNDGIWLKDQNEIDSLDQSIENAIWLNEVAKNLS